MFILWILLILYGMDSRELLTIIGSIVRSKRRTQNISQERLAELADLHPTYISEIERGKVNASITTFYQIATVLKIDFGELLNLPTANIDEVLEGELNEVVCKIRQIDKSKQRLVLLAVKGILSGIESI